MIKSGNGRHNQSHTGFIMVHGSSKEESPVTWEWLTQRNLKQKQNKQEPSFPRHSYSEKKYILTSLQPKSRLQSTFTIKEGFTINQKARAASTASCTTTRMQKKLKPFVYINSHEQQMHIPDVKFGIQEEQLIGKMNSAKTNGMAIIGIISVRRLGLRYKLNQALVEYCSSCKSSHTHDLKDITSQVRKSMKQFSRTDKELYYFLPKGIPLHYYRDIDKYKTRVLIVDSSPKLQFSEDLQLKVMKLASSMQSVLAKLQNILNITYPVPQKQQKGVFQLNEKPIYDYQKIKNVKEYVDRIILDPSFKIKKEEVGKDDLLTWYEEKFAESPSNSKKQTDKNLLFQSNSHFPNEIVSRKLLSLANQKVENLQTTNNRHKFIPKRIDLMMEQVRREESKTSICKNNDLLLDAPRTKKDMLAFLDKKNSLLSTQNIPYLIEKYGLNRYELFNLYNLYKSFEKVALMRNPSNGTMIEVSKRGIDRETFQVGLKGLDMNPGDELIRNICYFGDFISWEQFIKIISISLRKTPEEKLTAILKGISSSSDIDYLTRHQISLMIGNSLHKLFDQQQPELRQYFTNMAMAQFDSDGSGGVSIDELKERVLGSGSQNMNMVSFLILNT